MPSPTDHDYQRGLGKSFYDHERALKHQCFVELEKAVKTWDDSMLSDTEKGFKKDVLALYKRPGSIYEGAIPEAQHRIDYIEYLEFLRDLIKLIEKYRGGLKDKYHTQAWWRHIEPMYFDANIQIRQVRFHVHHHDEYVREEAA